MGIEDMLHRIPSIAKIKAVVGWEPRLGLERILVDFLVQAHRSARPGIAALSTAHQSEALGG